jgi:hypothetical protein
MVGFSVFPSVFFLVEDLRREFVGIEVEELTGLGLKANPLNP